MAQHTHEVYWHKLGDFFVVISKEYKFMFFCHVRLLKFVKSLADHCLTEQRLQWLHTTRNIDFTNLIQERKPSTETPTMTTATVNSRGGRMRFLKLPH